MLDQTLKAGDVAFFVAFNDQVVVSTEFSSEVSRLRQIADSVRAVGGSALNDAVYHGASKFFVFREPFLTRNVLILVADGGDNASRISLQEAAELAQRYQVTIYAVSTVGTAPPTGQVVSDSILRKLAEATGGRAFFPVDDAATAAAMREIADELRSVHLVTAAVPGTLPARSKRSIDIRPLNPDLKLRFPTAYFTP